MARSLPRSSRAASSRRTPLAGLYNSIAMTQLTRDQFNAALPTAIRSNCSTTATDAGSSGAMKRSSWNGESQLAAILNSSLRGVSQKPGVLIGETVNAYAEIDRAACEHDGVEHAGGQI